MIETLQTGWHPSSEEYHALAKEGVISSSMLLDFMPPWGRPRLYKEIYVDRTRAKPLVGIDAWRGTIVDTVLTEGGSIGMTEYMASGVVDASGRVLGVIPPAMTLRSEAQKTKWKLWKEACAREGVGLIGLRQDKRGKEVRELAKANELLQQVQDVASFIKAGLTPAAELARELLMGDSGISQLSHRFSWEGLELRWRPDRLVEIPTVTEEPYGSLVRDYPDLGLGGYIHASLKVTRHAHPLAFWAHYQKEGWGMRDAFYELGWSVLTSENDDVASELPWHEDWRYIGEEPIDWIVTAAHHEPVTEVYVHVVPENQRRLGRKRCTQALELLKRCYASDEWLLPEERVACLGENPRPWEW